MLSMNSGRTLRNESVNLDPDSNVLTVRPWTTRSGMWLEECW
jgi:hypothetical protein